MSENSGVLLTTEDLWYHAGNHDNLISASYHGQKRGQSMSRQINPKVTDLLKKGADLNGLDQEEAELLLRLDLGGRETHALMETADRISREQFGNKGENHYHIGINVEPCPFNCKFCSLTKSAGIFTNTIPFSNDTIINWATNAEAKNADALNIMTTGTYSFDCLLEVGKMLRERVSTPLVANTRDINHKEGEKLLNAGFIGAYHALRLGEGRDTPFKREKRIKTIEVIKDVGLHWMNCVEPVGPEHSIQEIAELMVLARNYGATYSGVMRRINFPGSPFETFGMITEGEMARMVAVSRLVMGDIPRAHCLHEPSSLSLIAGGNLFFPEVGASPRDSEADTGKGRGKSIEECRQIFKETGWNPDLPSNCFEAESDVKSSSPRESTRAAASNQ
jgi:biotin synthase